MDHIDKITLSIQKTALLFRLYGAFPWSPYSLYLGYYKHTITANIRIHSWVKYGILYVSLLFKKGGDSVMGELNIANIGNFLAVVLQGILIHVISHMLIEFFKSKK